VCAAPAGGGGGGLLGGALDAVGGGGLADAAAGLLGGGAGQSDPWAACVQSLNVDLRAAPGVDACVIDAAAASLPSVAMGDALQVELGYADQLGKVFTGKVARIDARHDGSVRISLDSGALTLARLRTNTSYEQQTLADIVKKLLGTAGLQSGTVSTGNTYPFVALDDRQSLWAWVGELAAQAGLLAWVDAEGKVQVQAGGGASAATFTYGADILSLAHSSGTAVAGDVTVIGEGAAGSQGTQAWSWLSKQRSPVAAQQGSGDVRQHSEAALRNMAGMQASTQAWGQRLTARATTVQVTVPGQSALSVGSTFTLASCPQGRGDGDFVATRVQHRYDKRQGFVTQLTGQAAGGTP
jgi:phage protein D